MIIFLVVFVMCLIYIVRLFLVIVGMYKDPVLETFEVYGEFDPIYYPWPNLLVALGVLSFAGGLAFEVVFGASTTLTTVLAVLAIISAFIAYHWKYMFQSYAEKLRFPPIPAWYGKLCEETSRYERRRIAYMWLHLPLRTRLLYNARDRFFFQWAELVIMASIRES